MTTQSLFQHSATRSLVHMVVNIANQKQEGLLPPTGSASAALCYTGAGLIEIALYLHFG